MNRFAFPHLMQRPVDFRTQGKYDWSLYRAVIEVPLQPSSSFSLWSLDLRDTKVYEPEIRALLGTASHFCEAVVVTPSTLNLQLTTDFYFPDLM